MEREFPDNWIGRGNHSLLFHSPDFTPLGFYCGGLLKTLFIVKKCKTWVSCITKLSELQSALPVKCLPIPASVLEKLVCFQAVDLTEFLMCSPDFNMSMTCIKAIFSFLPLHVFQTVVPMHHNSVNQYHLVQVHLI